MFDTYVRLRIDELQQMLPQHLYSEIEPGAAGTALGGFTEWSVPGALPGQALSFGWDWAYEPGSGQLLGQWATLRTNLMVVDEAGADMGTDCTRLCIARLLTHVRWERTIAEHLHLTLRLPPD